MKRGLAIQICLILGFDLCSMGLAAAATLKLIPNAEPQHVFFGASRKISTTFRNTGDQDFEGEIRARIYQTSSATTVKSGEMSRKTLHILPQQTVLESAEIDFPAVKAPTKFLVQWLENKNQIIGATEVWVYPTNLLAELTLLIDEKSAGVFDPLNQLKPLLDNSKQEFVNLENAELENFSGKLAIFGPFESTNQMRAHLGNDIRSLGKKNVAVVWLQPPNKAEQLVPSFYAVREKEVAIVVVQSELVPDLAENPCAQLNLVHFCKMALMPKPFTLPNSPLGHSDP